MCINIVKIRFISAFIIVNKFIELFFTALSNLAEAIKNLVQS